jgi:hypothetical protein
MQQWELCPQWTNFTTRCWAAVSAPMNWLDGDHVVTPTETSRNNRRSCVFCVLVRVAAIQRESACSQISTRVEAGSNTSTVILRVVGDDEKGSLESETVKYGHES